MDDFQGKTGRFLAWFKSVGGEFRDDLLEIQDLRSRDAGRGIVAIKDIAEETILFAVPREAIINVETSDLAKKLPTVFEVTRNDKNDTYTESVDPWISLTVVMLYEYLQGEASRWKPYIDILPTTFDTPIFWNQKDMEELEGTMLTIEKIGKHESDEMLRSRIIPVVAENPTVFYPDGAHKLSEDDLLALVHRIGSTIMSYAFNLDDDEETTDDEEEGWVEDREGLTMLGMVPMADILNANAEFNTHVNHGESLEVTALRPVISAGTEILNYYGPLPSSELLRRYGYVTHEHHRYDVAELSWALIRSMLVEHLNLSDDILDEAECQLDEEMLEEYFIFERDSGDPTSEGQLTQAVKFCTVPSELNEQLKAILKAIAKSEPKFTFNTRKREEILPTVIAKALRIKLTQYPTSVVEDKQLAESKLSKRHRMAIQVRLGEKQLLQEAINSIVTEDEDELSESAQERPSKRPKARA